MTDPEAQLLARVLISQYALLKSVTRIAGNLAEWAAHVGNDPRQNRISSDVEQLQAAFAEEPLELAQLRKHFRIPKE